MTVGRSPHEALRELGGGLEYALDQKITRATTMTSPPQPADEILKPGDASLSGDAAASAPSGKSSMVSAPRSKASTVCRAASTNTTGTITRMPPRATAV